MREEWLRRIRAAFPDLDIRTVSHNSEGLVHDVVIVNEARVFRFPKTDRARESLQREIRLLDLIRPHVDLRMPEYDFRGEDFASYELIPGKALLRQDIFTLDRAAQEHLAEQIGRFHAQLHSIPLSASISLSQAQRAPEDWHRMYGELRSEAYPFLMADAREWIERHFAPVLSGELSLEYAPALINGDIGPYHILYDVDRQTTNGIIDFGTAGAGDPAGDVALLIVNYGETFLQRVAHYCASIPDLIERARFFAGNLELFWLLSGIRSRNISWLTVHIGKARDVLPVGSGWPG